LDIQYILFAFVFTPDYKSEAGNTGSNRNHSGLDIVDGGICGPSLIHKLRFGRDSIFNIQFQSLRFNTLHHLVIVRNNCIGFVIPPSTSVTTALVSPDAGCFGMLALGSCATRSSDF
jgi:hypothetical protein